MALKGRYIDRSPLESAAFKSAGYHPETQTLALEFKGSIHHLADVSQEEADAFLAAESKGKHYHQYLREKTHEKVEAPAMGSCEACDARGLVGFLCQDCGTRDYA